MENNTSADKEMDKKYTSYLVAIFILFLVYETALLIVKLG